MAKTNQTNAGEDAGKGEHLLIVGGSANRYTHYGNQCEGASKRGKNNLPQDPALSVLNIYPKTQHATKETLAYPCLLVL